MTFTDVMNSEREAILAEYAFTDSLFRTQIPPYSAVPIFDILLRTPSVLRARHPVQVDELPGKRSGYAFVQTCPTLNYKFLWAHVDNDNYRNDYFTFAQKHHNVSGSELPENLHVDHLFNRERARAMQLTYIRMVLAPQDVNTSHGAGYEKSRTQGAIGRVGRERQIDEVMLMKLLGVPSPRKGKPLSGQMQHHVGRIAAQFGLPASEIERNIRELMEVANFRPPE